jgi:integrase
MKRTSHTFVLKDPKAKDRTLIYLIIRLHGTNDRIKYSTGEKLEPKYWNKTTRRGDTLRAKGDEVTKNRIRAINAVLKRHEDVYESVNSELKLQGGEPELKLFEQALNKVFRPDSDRGEHERYLVEFAEKYRDQANVAPASKTAYTGTIKAIKAYQDATGKHYTFGSIDLDFYDGLYKYLSDEGFQLNTIGKHFKNIKVFMQGSLDRELHNNTMFKNKRFKVVSEEADNIYLNEADLTKLWELDLSENKSLAAIRDLFILGCRTGVRFSDLHNITSDNLVNGTFKFRTTKGEGETVAIPLHWQVREVLERHGENLPRIPSNVKFNKYLKTLAEKANLNDKVGTTKMIKGIKRTTHQFKWEKVCTHTARRTFATLAFMAGVPSISIMKITGHRTEKAFLKYIKIGVEENAELMKTHAFFSPLKAVK